MLFPNTTLKDDRQPTTKELTDPSFVPYFTHEDFRPINIEDLPDPEPKKVYVPLPVQAPEPKFEWPETDKISNGRVPERDDQYDKAAMHVPEFQPIPGMPPISQPVAPDVKKEIIGSMPNLEMHHHTIGVLSAEQIKELEHIFTARGVGLPNPDTSFVIGAIDNHTDKLTENFLVVQLQVHAEPLHLVKGEGEYLFRPFANLAYRVILDRIGPASVYVFSDSEKVTTLAQHAGFDKLPWTVLGMLVTKEFKEKPVKESGATEDDAK